MKVYQPGRTYEIQPARVFEALHEAGFAFELEGDVHRIGISNDAQSWYGREPLRLTMEHTMTGDDTRAVAQQVVDACIHILEQSLVVTRIEGN